MTSVVTVRINDELKKALERYGIEVSRVTRSALEEEVRKARIAEAEKAAERLQRSLSKVPEEKLLAMIREDREHR